MKMKPSIGLGFFESLGVQGRSEEMEEDMESTFLLGEYIYIYIRV